MDPPNLRSDSRVVANDDDRIVLKIRPPGRIREVPLLIIGSAVLAAAAVALFWWLVPTRTSVWPLVLIWILLTASAGLFATREATLVALRPENQLFVEWRNTMTRRKHRTLFAQLTQLERYEVRPLLDLDSDIVPHQVYELRLIVNGKSVEWYCDSREVAETIGEELLRLRDAA